jgi:hypothetical protein
VRIEEVIEPIDVLLSLIGRIVPFAAYVLPGWTFRLVGEAVHAPPSPSTPTPPPTTTPTPAATEPPPLLDAPLLDAPPIDPAADPAEGAP